MAMESEIVARGLDPKKPWVVIDGTSAGLEMKAFFRSLRSEKVDSPKSVKLMWRTNDVSTPLTTLACVRVLIESMTQVYTVWPASEETEEPLTSKLAEWVFTGRLWDRGEEFDASPRAVTRVRGYIDLTQLGEERVEAVYLQVVDGTLELPPHTGYIF